MPPQEDGTEDLDMSEGYLYRTAARCKVCQARSTGIHYGVQSCEGCKAFFKRGMVKKSSYKCYFGNACEVTPKTRSRCKACRLQKCINEGMSIEGAKSRMSKAGKDSAIAYHIKLDSVEPRINLSELEPTTERADSHASTSGERVDHGDMSGSSDNLESVMRTGTFGPQGTPSLGAPSRLSVIRSISSVHSADLAALSPFSEMSTIRKLADSRDESDLKTTTVQSLLAHSLLAPNPFCSGMVPGLKTKLDLSVDDGAPSFMTRYWTIMKEKNSCLEDSIKAVTEAVKTVYWDQIDDWTKFMTKAITFGEVPVQPQTTFEAMQRHFQTNIYDEVVRSVQFTALVPGFTDLPQADQSACIGERGFHIWLIRHAPFIQNGEVYRLTAEGALHYCRYWLDILLEPDFLNFILHFAEQFNALHLTLAETYVFLTTALFWPEPAEETKATYSNLLYMHYLDALVNMIGSKRSTVLGKLQEMTNQFGVLKKIQAAYCLTMDVSQVPYRSSAGLSFEVIRRKSAGEMSLLPPVSSIKVLCSS